MESSGKQREEEEDRDIEKRNDEQGSDGWMDWIHSSVLDWVRGKTERLGVQ